MTGSENEKRIDYVEFPSTDISGTKAFYGKVFGWQFTDFGPEYVSFGDGRLNGGFFKAEECRGGGPLVVIYASDLEGTESMVIAAGGNVVKEIFAFPGGRRFHFQDPSGNVLAVWSDR